MQNLIYGREPAVLICADGDDAIARAAASIRSAGARVTTALPIARAAEMLDDLPAPEAVFVEVARDDGAALDRLLDRLDAAASSGRYPSIVAVPRRLVDVAAARAPHAAVTLLCEAEEGERVGALGLALAARPAMWLEERNDDSPMQLRKLSEEVGRIARALASMSSEEKRTPPLAERDRSRPAELPTAAALRALIRARRLRDQYFDPELFADPAWDMLLDLMLARIERRTVAVSSLCIAAAVPPTTALRWIKRLTDEGLFVRTADPRDGRRVFIDLSDPGAETMAAYLRARSRLSVSAI